MRFFIYFSVTVLQADLSKLGGPGHGGILVLSNEITKCNKISIIHQSPAGIYEQEIDLKTL